MPVLMNAAATDRLTAYFDEIGELLGSPSRRQSFAVYASGILGDAARKSAEPIATRAHTDVRTADAAHQSLLHFISNSKWNDQALRTFAARYALQAMKRNGPVAAWIVDDTGFIKKGEHSVGVQRQYTGSAGKVTNCQIGVSLTIATAEDHVPIDFELYLPQSWTSDEKRRHEARIPDALTFKTKHQLAIDMLRRAVKNKVPKAVVLADSAYGTSHEFRTQIRELGLHYAVGVDPRTTVWELYPTTQPCAAKASVKDIAMKLEREGGFRRTTWREGTKQDLSARFAALRVVTAQDDGTARDQRRPQWLLIEWRDGETEPSNYFLSSLSSQLNKKQLIRIVMQRWRTERAYQDLKDELGLDHFEGRRFPGWHHHVTVVLCCYAFIVAERVRRFPPSAVGSMGYDTDRFAARETLPGQLHHGPSRDRPSDRCLAS